MFTPQTFLIQERGGVKKILSIFTAKPLQKITIKLLIKSLQTGSWASGENCRLRDGSRHLPSRLLPQGRQGHASSEVDASRGIPRRNLHFKNRRVVSLLTSWNKKWTLFTRFLALLSNTTWAYQNVTHALTQKYSLSCMFRHFSGTSFLIICDELPKSKSNGHTKGRSIAYLLFSFYQCTW